MEQQATVPVIVLTDGSSLAEKILAENAELEAARARTADFGAVRAARREFAELEAANVTKILDAVEEMPEKFDLATPESTDESIC